MKFYERKIEEGEIKHKVKSSILYKMEDFLLLKQNQGATLVIDIL